MKIRIYIDNDDLMPGQLVPVAPDKIMIGQGWSLGDGIYEDGVLEEYERGRAREPAADLDLERVDRNGKVLATLTRRIYSHANNRPSDTVFETKDAEGRLRQRHRFHDDRLNDGPNGEPALESFDEAGRVTSRSRFSGGVLHDNDGEPARVEFHEGTDRIRLIEHYYLEELNDPESDAPAIQHFDEAGMLVASERYEHGEPKPDHASRRRRQPPGRRPSAG